MNTFLRLTTLIGLSLSFYACGVSGSSTTEDDQSIDAIWALYHQERYSEAEQGFLEYAWNDLEAPEAWSGLGWSRFHLGSFSQARQAFQQSLVADPSWLDSRGGDAFAQRQNGDQTRLIAQARYVLSNNPAWTFEHELHIDQMDLWVLGAQVWFQEQDFDSCLTWLSSADSGLSLSRLDTLSWNGAPDFASALLTELERLSLLAAP
jgi:tetratricopeptide (TPR) repeat protein